MPTEIEKHNEVTRLIIVGILCQEGGNYTEISESIMRTLANRGYEPQIVSCNQLKDGTYV